MSAEITEMRRLLCTVTNDLTYDRRMQRICRSLARAGYAVTLIGRERPASQPPAPEPYRQVRLRCCFDRGMLFYAEYNLRLLTYLLSHPFDIVCAVDLDTILPVFFAGRLRRKICVYDAHEYFTETPEIIRRPLIRWVWRIVARLTIPHVRYAYTVGPALAEQLAKRYGTPFGVVRNLPEQSPEAPSGPFSGRPVVLYQGALNEGRGLEAAIDAMSLLPGVELWLVGEGDLSRQLRKRVRQAGLDDRVRFLGFAPPQELAGLTRQAHIGLNLLENKGLSYYYSLANKTFDYIQAGLPSLQMDFPEYRRLQELYGAFLLLDQLSPGAVAEAVHKLLPGRELYRQLRNNCLRARTDLVWEKEEKVLLDFYSRLGRPKGK